jgi:zinc transporter ZupT
MFEPKKLFLMGVGAALGATIGFATMGARRKKGALMPTAVGALAGAATLAVGEEFMPKAA